MLKLTYAEIDLPLVLCYDFFRKRTAYDYF